MNRYIYILHTCFINTNKVPCSPLGADWLVCRPVCLLALLPAVLLPLAPAAPAVDIIEDIICTRYHSRYNTRYQSRHGTCWPPPPRTARTAPPPRRSPRSRPAPAARTRCPGRRCPSSARPGAASANQRSVL